MYKSHDEDYRTIEFDLISKYDLKVDSCEPIIGGLEHHTYLVTAGAKKAVLRIYRNRTKTAAENEADLLLHLHQQQAIAPYIVKMLPSIEGKFIHESNGRHYCLFEYVIGCHPVSLAAEQLDTLINVIKSIHHHGLTAVEQYSGRALSDGRCMQMNFQDACNHADITADQFAVINEIIKLAHIAAGKYVAKTVIHYDVHWANILISNAIKKPVLLDFDDFIVASPIFELVVMVRGLCCKQQGFDVELATTILFKYDLGSSIEPRFYADEFLLFILFDLVRVCDACLHRFDGAEKFKLFSENYQKIEHLLVHRQSILAKLSIFNRSSSLLPVIELLQVGWFAKKDASSDLARVVALLPAESMACSLTQ